MCDPVKYSLNKASVADIVGHLRTCDVDFMPPLSCRVEIKEYAQKIAAKATRLEAWSGGMLIGLMAVYCNDQKKRISYITSISVLREWRGKDVAERLMCQCIEHARAVGMRQISLEVSGDNVSAIKLYEKNGFVAVKTNALFVSMNLYLKDWEDDEKQT